MAWEAGAAALGGVAQLAGTYMTNSANAAMAQKQMDFQERMSSSAYQRAMADMKMAGLNPILASKTGGASTPSGASAEMKDPISAAANAALSYKTQLATLENIKDQNAKLRSEIDLINEQVSTESVRLYKEKLAKKVLDYGVTKVNDLIGSVDYESYTPTSGKTARTADLDIDKLRDKYGPD